MAAEVESLPSPPLLASEREMSACQVDVRLDSNQAGQSEGQRVGDFRAMAQGGTAAEQELGIKLLMTSKDVGSIIGKGGMTIKAFRESSGARINISNSTSSERLVQINGTVECITKAFSAIGKKIELDNIVAKQQSLAEGQVETDATGNAVVTPTNVTFRLIIQSSQCGSLIGKGGAIIKEIRESTGVSIQVAGEHLPNSTERAVTLTGSPEALTVCVRQMCNIMLENPARGPHIPYKPMALPSQAFQPRANPNLPYQTPYTATFQTAASPATTTQQMRIPNNLIGCVIGRKGTKIHEIRVTSGAQIKIAGNEGDESDRLVTITGTPDAVGVAQYLISSRIHSEVNTFLTLAPGSGSGGGAGGGAGPGGGGMNLPS